MLRQVKKELLSGQNIEVYFTILLSFVAFILSLFNVVDLWIINTLILAVLCLLTVHILQERWLRQEFIAKLFPQHTWDKVENEMRERLQSATKVKFMAISPLSILRKYNKILEQILKNKDGEIKFIIVDPKSKAMELVKQGRPENYDDGILFLQEICKSFNEYINNKRLKVKLIDYIPSQIVTILDERGAKGIIFATVYSFNQVDPHRPSEIITLREGIRYSFFENEFNILWNIGEDFICNREEKQCNKAHTD